MLNFNVQNQKNSLNIEWITSNGLGGYASSTVSGANTRRYHGLLVAALSPPVDRRVLVTKIEESILLKNREQIPLSSNFYPEVIHPCGYRHIESFERYPMPVTRFRHKRKKLSKTIFMVHGSNTTVVQYQLICSFSGSRNDPKSFSG